VDVTTGLGYPKKARDAERNPKVSLLFSDPTGSGIADPPVVLVQGIAIVDDADVAANHRRYLEDIGRKMPAAAKRLPPDWVQRRWFLWYFARIYVHVRPERVYRWPAGDPTAEPELLDTHMEEVRSGHVEDAEVVPEAPPAAVSGAAAWDGRLAELGTRYRTAVLSWRAPDGFPFSVRVPVRADAVARVVRIDQVPTGAPIRAGRVCLTAHEHDDAFSYQLNFQVRGDLVEQDGNWVLVPRKLVGGFELPKGGPHRAIRANWTKARRYHRVATRELERRSRG
jgi:hypothetical protein